MLKAERKKESLISIKVKFSDRRRLRMLAAEEGRPIHDLLSGLIDEAYEERLNRF